MLDNAARNKRRAHAVSRSSNEQSWNPFRHVTWDKRSNTRAETWDGGRLEEAREDDNTTGDRLTHAVSEPPRQPGTMSLDDAITGTKEEGARTRTPVSDEKAPSQRALVDGDAGLRNRKQEEDEAAKLEAAKADDNNGKKKPKKEKTGLLRHVEPKTPFTVANQLQRTLLNSWINVLLVAAPVGIALNYVKSVDRIAVFVINFIAIIPLAAMLSFATEEIALRTGETLGGLLNATFGNAVEVIIAIIALIDDQVRIVQTSLVGSILSNLLLVLGFCFFFGGLRRPEQYFNHVVAQTAASLLALAVASVIVPTVFDYASDTPVGDVAKLSRGTAVILLLVYGAYLFFQLKTHHAIFSEESQKVAAKPWSRGSAGALKQGIAMPGALMGHGMPDHDENERLHRMLMNPPRQNINDDEDDDDEEEPQLHFYVAIATLAGSTVVIALCAEYMVNSIDAVTKSGGLSEEFVGLILLPIVGNAAEHATAVTVAIKDKMDLAIGVAVGSSMQVALFVIPLLVIVGWGMGMEDMNLSFDMFQVAVMFVAVLLVNYLIGDGKSHWLEGFLLICLYSIIAVCAFCKSNQPAHALSEWCSNMFQGTPTDHTKPNTISLRPTFSERHPLLLYYVYLF